MPEAQVQLSLLDTLLILGFGIAVVALLACIYSMQKRTVRLLHAISIQLEAAENQHIERRQ